MSTTTHTPQAGPAPTTKAVAARNTPLEPPPRTQAIASPAPADDEEAPSPTTRRAASRATLLALCVVLAAHAWIVSAGWMSLPWPQYSNYYARLAEAFDHRQASLLQEPDPGLLALPDPFEPVASRPYRQQNGVHDCVLFDGKLYLYWGPVPALLLVPFQRLGHGTLIGDQYLVFAFTVGAIGFTALLLRRLWERFFPEQPAWTLFVGIMVCGLAAPIAYLLARSAVYEAAIMGGQFFLTAGLYLLVAPPWVLPQPNWKRPVAAAKLPGSDDPLVAAFMGGHLIRPRRLPARKPPFGSTGAEAAAVIPAIPANLDPLPSPFRLALVGGCWALAVGSRVSLAIAVIALSAIVCLWIFRRSCQAKKGIGLPRLAAFGLPLVAGAVALASYNYARFGNLLEFGQRYQLAASNYHAFPALFSLKNVPPNLYSYALRPVYVLKGFPFLEARIGDGTFPSFIPLPPHYEYSEPIAGMLLTAPFVWLAAVPVFGILRAGWFFLFVRSAGFSPYRRSERGIRAEARTTNGEGNRSQVEADPSPAADPDLVRILTCLACAIVLAFLPVLLMVGSTMRYLADVWPCLAVLSVVGVWQRRSALASCGAPPRRHKTFNTVVLSLASGTVVVGMLLSITGYYDHFLHHNPDLFAPLSYRTRPAILGHEQ